MIIRDRQHSSCNDSTIYGIMEPTWEKDGGSRGETTQMRSSYEKPLLLSDRILPEHLAVLNIKGLHLRRNHDWRRIDTFGIRNQIAG